jgi:t-SNARE complex subunit (syntaxin)
MCFTLVFVDASPLPASLFLSAQNVDKGAKNLDEALAYQKKARKRRCMILLCLMGGLVVVLVPTLLSTVGKS